MRKESISFLIDKSISEAYINGFSHLSIIALLFTKMTNLKNVLHKEKPEIILEDLALVEDWTSITPIRARYTVFYVEHCNKRVDDVRWIEKNKYKFTKFSNSQIFNLVKLKEKLTPKFEKYYLSDQVLDQDPGGKLNRVVKLEDF